MFPETVATLPDINICNYEGVVSTTALILLLWGWIRRKKTDLPVIYNVELCQLHIFFTKFAAIPIHSGGLGEHFEQKGVIEIIFYTQTSQL